jgi:hypothetical protein
MNKSDLIIRNVALTDIPGILPLLVQLGYPCTLEDFQTTRHCEPQVKQSRKMLDHVASLVMTGQPKLPIASERFVGDIV